MPMTAKYHELLMKSDDVRPTNVEMRRMIESALDIFQEYTMDPMEAMVETKLSAYSKMPIRMLRRTESPN